MSEADDGRKSRIASLKHELDLAQQALREPGAGAIGNLECRVADLQGRFLATPALSLEDVITRLEMVRILVNGLGPRGYLLDLVDATLADLRVLAGR